MRTIYISFLKFVLLILLLSNVHGCKTHERVAMQSVRDSVVTSFDSLHLKRVFEDTTFHHVIIRDSSFDVVTIRKAVEDVKRVKIDTANTRRKQEENRVKDKSVNSDQLNSILELFHLLIKIVVIIVIGLALSVGTYFWRGRNKI